MSDCNVLRCARPAAAVIRLTPADGLLLESVVCAEHKAEMDAGKPWRWEETAGPGASLGSPTGRIVMGADFDVSRLTIVGVVGAENDASTMATDGTPATTLVFEQLLSDGSTAELRLLMSRQVIDDLGDMFDTYLRPRRRTGDDPADGEG